MKSSLASLGWKEFFVEKARKHKLRWNARIEKDALCYDAHCNRYSIAPKSVPANLFYSMELGARMLIDAWPFLNNRLLDIGCGKKPYALLINSLVRKYIGIDLTGSRNGWHVDTLADGLHLPFRAESFDTVLATDMIDEVLSPNLLFSESNRILKSDGYFIVLVSNNITMFKRGKTYAHYTAEGLRFLAEKNGYNVVLLRTKGKMFPFLLNLIIQFLFRLQPKLPAIKKSNCKISNSKKFNAFILALQRFFLKITPKKCTKSDVIWEESSKKHGLAEGFHMGYLMVAKKVFNVM